MENKTLERARSLAMRWRTYYRSKQNYHRSAIEDIYGEAARAGKFPYRQAVKANWHISLFILRSAEQFSVLVGMVAVLAVTGAFDTNIDRLVIPLPVYWFFVAILATISMFLSIHLVGPLHQKFRVSYLLVVPLHICISSFLTVGTIQMVWPLISDSPAWPFPKALWEGGTVIGVGITTIFVAIHKSISFISYMESHSGNALELLLPMEMRGQILAISANDHYIEVQTANGSHLLRMSLAEAINQLPDDVGMQVHRSHWVNLESISKLEVIGTKNCVVLIGGIKIRVAKSYVEKIQNIIDTKK